MIRTVHTYFTSWRWGVISMRRFLILAAITCLLSIAGNSDEPFEKGRNSDAEFAHQFGIALRVRQGGRLPFSEGIELQQIRNAIVLNNYDEKGKRLVVDKSLKSLSQDPPSFRIPERMSVWFVSETGIVESTESVPDEILAVIIRSRNGSLRIVNMMSGQTAWFSEN